MARYMAFLMCIESEKGSTEGIESHPNLVEILYGGNGGGFRWRELAGDDDEVRRRRAMVQWGAGTSGVEKFQPFSPRDIYTRTLSVAPS